MRNSNTIVALFAGTLFATTMLSTPVQTYAGNSSIMLTGKRTSQPIGHYEFCQQNFAECNVKSRKIAPTKLTRSKWKQMVEANAHANYTIEPVTDIEFYGVEELWAYPASHGDCEDYVLLKRNILIQQGWPASSLLVTVVRQKSGDGHAVLTVRTDRGDYILDNLNDRIKTWNDTEYTYLKRISPKHSGWWEDIKDTRSFVGSVSN